jgi:flavin-dependent dehydrogenase
MRKVRGVCLYAPGGRAIELHAPGYHFQSTDTAALLRWMAQQAEHAGVTLLYGKRFDTAEAQGAEYLLPSFSLRARYLIGADGARSRVAELFGLGRNRRFLAGLEIECEPIAEMDSRFLHCFADSRIAPGYIGWAVPGPGFAQIGVAATRGRKPELGLLVDRLCRMWGITDLRIIERRSGLIPTGGPVSPIGRDRVLLIGDAAGLVSPLTGGGIHTALQFGRRAAQLVGDYLYDRGPHPMEVFAREIPRYAAKRALRRILDLAPPNPLIDMLLATAPMRGLAQRIYFHRRRGDQESFEAWQREFETQQYDPSLRHNLRGSSHMLKSF